MCPACLSIAAVYAAGAGSFGGVATLAFKRFRRRPIDERGNKKSARGGSRNEAIDSTRANIEISEGK